MATPGNRSEGNGDAGQPPGGKWRRWATARREMATPGNRPEGNGDGYV